MKEKKDDMLMVKVVLLLVFTVILGGMISVWLTRTTTDREQDPAKIFCDDRDGEPIFLDGVSYNYCLLPDGTMCELYAYWHSDGEECVSPEMQE